MKALLAKAAVVIGCAGWLPAAQWRDVERTAPDLWVVPLVLAGLLVARAARRTP